jgi:hypothetical protein
MLTLAVDVVIVFFVGMGLVALVSPEFVTRTFGIPTLTTPAGTRSAPSTAASASPSRRCSSWP